MFPGHEGWTHLAADERERVVVGAKPERNAERYLVDVKLFVRQIGRKDIAADAARCFRRIAHVADRVSDLASGLGKCLALFLDEQPLQQRALSLNALADFVEVVGAFDRRQHLPALLGVGGALQCPVDIFAGARRNLSECLPGCRVFNGDPLTVG